MEESEERDRRLAERAEEISGILNKSVITIEARTGEDERLFGSVTAANIADAVERARGIRLDRRRIRLAEPIKASVRTRCPSRSTAKSKRASR